MNPTEIDLLLKFRTDKFPIRFPVEFSIGQLKDEIQALTNVPAERQKVVSSTYLRLIGTAIESHQRQGSACFNIQESCLEIRFDWLI